MKRLLILTVLGMLLGSAAGCRFWDCLWRGPACQHTMPTGCRLPIPLRVVVQSAASRALASPP